jgi:hypothetical protein
MSTDPPSPQSTDSPSQQTDESPAAAAQRLAEQEAARAEELAAIASGMSVRAQQKLQKIWALHHSIPLPIKPREEQQQEQQQEETEEEKEWRSITGRLSGPVIAYGHYV